MGHPIMHLDICKLFHLANFDREAYKYRIRGKDDDKEAHMRPQKTFFFSFHLTLSLSSLLYVIILCNQILLSFKELNWIELFVIRKNLHSKVFNQTNTQESVSIFYISYCIEATIINNRSFLFWCLNFWIERKSFSIFILVWMLTKCWKNFKHG